MHLVMTFALLNLPFFFKFNFIHKNNLFLFSSNAREIFLSVESSITTEDMVNLILK